MIKISIVGSILIFHMCMDVVFGSIDNCNSYTNDTSTQKCTSCKDKFCLSSDYLSCLPSSSGCMKCNPSGVCSECIPSSYLVVNTGQCQLCTLNCNKCNGDKCVECVKGYSNVSTDGSVTCIKCSDNCVKCNSTNVCQQCAQNFQLQVRSENGTTLKNCTAAEASNDTIKQILYVFIACVCCVLMWLCICFCPSYSHGRIRRPLAEDIKDCCNKDSKSTESTPILSESNNINQNQQANPYNREMMPPSSGMSYGQSPKMQYGY